MEGGLLIPLRGYAQGVAKQAVTFLEPRNIGPDSYNLTHHILPRDGGIFVWQPGKGLQTIVDGVGCGGVVLNENLVCFRGPNGSGLDFKRRGLWNFNPGRTVRSHGITSFRFVVGRSVQCQVVDGVEEELNLL